MAQTSYFANTMSVAISTTAGSTLTLGILGGVEIMAEWDNVELYGTDTLKREDVKRTKTKVTVTAKTSKFHPDAYGHVMGTRNTNKDLEGGTSSGRTQATITDSNTVTLFELVGTVTGKNDETFKVKVQNFYFENLPFAAPADEFMQLEISGIGDDMIVEYTTT